MSVSDQPGDSRRASVFEGLKKTSHVAAHRKIFWSILIHPAAEMGSSTNNVKTCVIGKSAYVRTYVGDII